ncbi:class I SAM-dependent methyltransferase [Mycetocola spongiae]|uniref:class I SAM-dependent methyltransferase n=1 Tax=Mycetocola spongiae TaxID=2859226 RepID=UPI001CF15EDD|nr:class I SAM-dependent methyltransferase [Mycetocola spongiae]UCR89587.1 class I SAM-dependent methyltransferase [Mycetocola spongiae]
MGHEVFDDLAADYDRFRPPYPRALFEIMANRLGRARTGHTPARVLDLGAGTGIALAGLREVLGPRPLYAAVDPSAAMVALGSELVPDALWHVGRAEPYLEVSRGVGLIMIAQAFHWMDVPRLLAAATRALVPGGVIAVLYNIRRHTDSAFLAEYEALLEELSPGYSRDHPDSDVLAALHEHLPAGTRVETHQALWDTFMTPEEFLGLAHSATSVQRARASHGAELDRRTLALVRAYLDSDGRVDVAYTSELVIASLPR